jgi:hypothetical protein
MLSDFNETAITLSADDIPAMSDIELLFKACKTGH